LGGERGGGEEGKEEKGRERRWKEKRKKKLGERKESRAIEGNSVWTEWNKEVGNSKMEERIKKIKILKKI
jgi:hypothetical protein